MRLPRPSLARSWIALAAGAAAAVACSREAGAPGTAAGAAPAEPPRAVETALVVEASWPRLLRVTGELAAFEAATLAAEVAGRLERLDVDLGTRVAAGEVLARIVPRDYELRIAQAVAAVQAARARLGLPAEGNGDGDRVDPEQTGVVRAARAELDDAQREQSRLEGLVQEQIVSQAALDTAVARRLAAESELQDAFEEVENRKALLAQRQAELALARQKLADTAIEAPFDGAVAARLADRGEFLDAGDPVVRVVRFDPVRLRLRVPATSASLVHVGQTVRVELGGGGAREGRLVRASPELEPRSRTLWVEAEFGNADGVLRPGSFVTADVVLDAGAHARVVPLAALVRFAGIDRVFVVADGKAEERRVTLGRTDAERAEVLEGLQAGEVVVVAPGSLRAGASVLLSP